MRSVLLVITTYCLCICFSCRSDSSPRQQSIRPNILFILVDDLGKEWVSCYGAEEIETPNIDALAASGMRFNHVYSMPQCTPTRLTLLSGQYPFRHGWVNHWDVPRWGGGAHFDENLYPSLGREMKRAGYKTAIAGKWQIDDFRVEPDALNRNGFDDWCMWTGYETGIPASGERYQDPYVFTKQGSRTYEGGFGPDVFRDFLIEKIQSHGQAKTDSPLFLYYPMVLPHTPFVNTPDETHEEDDKLGRHKAMVRYVDKITGQLVQALEAAGIRENTLIIWTTDNGTTRRMEARYQGRIVKGGKGMTPESGINAPFIASWPAKIAANSSSDALVDFTDIFPTFLDLADHWPVDGSEVGAVDGKSFESVLTEGDKRSSRNWILSMGGGNYAKLTEKGVENQYKFRDRVIRNERYKLFIGPDQMPSMFVDLQTDPTESINLMDSLDIGDGDRRRNYAQLFAVTSIFPAQDADPQYHPNPPQEWDVPITAESDSWKK